MDNLNLDIKNGYDLVTGKVEEWINQAIAILPNMVVAVVIVLVFALIARFAKKIALKMMGKVSDNRALSKLFSNVVKIALLSIGVFVALGILNLDKTVTSLLAGVGVIGLALGFAFQDTAANFVSGVFLAARRPFHYGDIVKSNGYFGKVKKLNLRNTIMETFTGQEILIPNKDVFQSPLENFSKKGLRRVDVACGVSYGDDLKTARRIAIDAIKDLDFVHDPDNVTLFFNEFGDSSINFNIRFWIKYGETNSTYLHAQSEAIIAIKSAFDENGIDIPFPIRTVDFGIKGGESLKEALPIKELQQAI